MNVLKERGFKEVFKLELIFDGPMLFIVWGITIFGSWFKRGNLILKLERASHLAKDAGELAAALGGHYGFYITF